MSTQRGIIAIKSHYKSTLSALESEIDDYPSLSIHKLDSVYPAGDEIILIKTVTGRTVNPGALPVSVGVTVCNVESVYNVKMAINGRPVTHKYVTVAGEVAKPQTLHVPLGTKISELIALAGGETVSEAEYICGGPMMGRLTTPHSVVTKTTNAIIVLPASHGVILNKKRNVKVNLRRTMSVCCQCRSCTELCSRHVLGYPVEPHNVMRVFSNGGRGADAAILGSLFCSGCGLCESYSCPQGLSPKQVIDEMKKTARAAGIAPPTGTPADTNVKDAKLKRVSVERLTARLGLRKYDVPAPLTYDYQPKRVKIMLSQHLGAPATTAVSVGDRVRVGDVIGKAKPDALSVNIHASIDGVVTAVTEKYVKIENK